jgi:hypothetical protein
MRQQYESEYDLKREREVANTIEKSWGCDMHKLNPHLYQIDYMATVSGNRSLLFWSEIKCRNNLCDTYPTLMLSLHKLMKGAELSRTTGSNFFIFVRFKDGTIMCHQYCDAIDYNVEYGGRTLKTRDSCDIEPVVHIPMDLFQKIA